MDSSFVLNECVMQPIDRFTSATIGVPSVTSIAFPVSEAPIQQANLTFSYCRVSCLILRTAIFSEPRLGEDVPGTGHLGSLVIILHASSDADMRELLRHNDEMTSLLTFSSPDCVGP